MSTKGVKETLDRLIADNKVVIISRSGCPICLGARNTIRKHFSRGFGQDQVAFVDIDREFETRAVQNYLKFLTGGSTVPQVFINGQYVGGRDDLADLHKSGRLAGMLQNDPT